MPFQRDRGRHRGTRRVIPAVTLMRHAGDLGDSLAMLETPSERAAPAARPGRLPGNADPRRVAANA